MKIKDVVIAGAVGVAATAPARDGGDSGLLMLMFVWPIIYAIFFFLSLTWDPTTTLPYHVTNTTKEQLIGMFFLLFIIGNIWGIGGGAGMVMFFYPGIILPFWLIFLGIGAWHPNTWEGYKRDHWIERCWYHYRGPYFCEYKPRPGEKLPSFIENWSVGANGKLEKIVPYGKEIGDPYKP